MTTGLKFQRGTTTNSNSTTLSLGELFVDTTKNTVVVHDGTTQGGTVLATEGYADGIQSSLVGNAPNDLNTLQEIAAAIDNDANFSNTVFNQLDSKIAFTDLSASGDLSYNASTGVFSVTTYKSTDFDSDFASKTTSDLTEGSNLYYENSKVDAHLSGGTGVNYSTGVISIGQSVGTTDDVTFNSVTVTQAPSQDTDAATKSYVDGVAQGITARPSARGATTQNLNASYSAGTLTANSTGALSVDGISDWSIGEELIVKDQTTQTQNGVYIVDDPGSSSTAYQLSRADFMDESAEVPSSFVFVKEGTDNANTGWVFTVADAGTFALDTDDITVIQFSGAGTFTAGDGLTLTGTEFSVNTGDGIAISNDSLVIPSSFAGVGLNLAAGVLSVDLADFTTSNLPEGTRLYYTDGRANSAIDSRVDKTFVDNLGIDADTLDGNDSNYFLNYNNLNNTPTALSQFTNDPGYILLTDLSATGDLNYNNTTGEFSVTTYKTSNFNSDFALKTTDDLTEGSNLYYSNSKVDSHLQGGTGVSYNAGTISIGQPVGISDSVEFSRVTANAGIAFDTPTTENTLRNYEQGSWTPAFDSLSLGSNRSTTVYRADYTRIGNKVTCTFSAELAQEGTGGSGQFVITGLPFVGSGSGIFIPSYFENLASPASYMSGAVQVSTGRVLVSILGTAGTSMTADPAFTDFIQAGTRIDGTIIYFVD
jgi:hypothetical protein